MVARQRVHRRLRGTPWGYRQGRLVRALRPVLVLLVARRRVHLVAAHDQYPPARQRRRTGDRQLRLGEQVGDRVRRVEPVADVGHVVEPRLAVVGALVEDGVRQRLLQFALVQVCTEPAGQDDAQRGDGELPRGQPRYRAARGEPELLGGEAARAGLLGVDSHGIGGYPNPLVPVRRGSRTLDRRCRLSSVGQSDALVMRRSSVRFRQAAHVVRALIKDHGPDAYLDSWHIRAYRRYPDHQATASRRDVMLNIIWAIIAGLVIGLLAKLVVPGRQAIPLWLTIVLGIVGALVGNWLATVFGVRHTSGIDWIRHFLQIGVAAVLIIIVAPLWMRRGARRSP